MTGSTVRVGVVGATGYAGMELIRMLYRHPSMELTYAAGSKDRAESFAELFPHLTRVVGPPVRAFHPDDCFHSCDLAFVALPSGESGRVAQLLWERGLKVIDLSGDLRLPAEEYRKWYDKNPVSSKAQEAAVYGLTEFYREHIAQATLVANPGCYATAALLALKPLERLEGVTPDRPLIIDAKSGVTGAGRGAKAHLQFAELTEDFYAYKVGQHQHIPEIERALQCDNPILLTTQLLPTARGIFASAYVSVDPGLKETEIYQHYLRTYEGRPFVEVLPPGRDPHLKSVRGSNFCHLSVALDGRTGMLQVFSVIDNLQKGAAGQALQNANLMCGFDERLGLDAMSSWV